MQFKNPELTIISVVSLVLMGFIVHKLFRYLNAQNAPIRTTVVIVMGLVVFLPIVLVLALFNSINEPVAALLGTYVGYLLSMASNKGEWG